MTAMFFAYSWSERKGYDNLENVSIHQLDLYASGLESELGKHEYVPSILELDEDVLALLARSGDTGLRDKVNKRLGSMNVRAGSIAIFVLDASGIVRASSNWYQPASNVGKDFSALPYFSDAIQSGQARFFAPSATTDSPEYYFAKPVRQNGVVRGVAVVKISLEPIESTWIAAMSHPLREIFLVVDENDVIIIASNPEWKYRKTTLLKSMLQARLTPSGKVTADAAEPAGMVFEEKLGHGSHLISMRAPERDEQARLYATQQRFMVRPGWHLITLSDASDVMSNARHAAAGVAALSAFIGALAMYLLQRRRAILNQLAARAALQRAHDELELRIVERTAELHDANQELLREVAERKHAEDVLREAQDELVQASKLALLGQMAAGVTHEINQPLTALRALSHNTQLLLKRGNIERIDRNLQSISDLTDRMARITEQLKSFARKAPLSMGQVLLSRAIENALLLLENRLRTEHVDLQLDMPDDVRVSCDGNRLEQVLINLCANALDAMQDTPLRRLTISVKTGDRHAHIRVSDSGSGIPPAAMARLFEPFFSTKPSGKGLGLGLVISAGIVHEFGGALRALNIPGGAAFEFDLKLVEESSNV